MIDPGGATRPALSEWVDRLHAVTDLARVLVWPLLLAFFLLLWRKIVLELLTSFLHLFQALVALLNRVKSLKAGGVELVCMEPEEMTDLSEAVPERPFLL